MAATTVPAVAVPGGKREAKAQGAPAAAKPAKQRRGKTSTAIAPARVKPGRRSAKAPAARAKSPARAAAASPSPAASPPSTTVAAPAVAGPPAAQRNRSTSRRRAAAGRRSPASGATRGARPSPSPLTAIPRPAGAARQANAPAPKAPRRDARAESSSAPVIRTVRDLVEVVPESVKMLLAAMAALSVVLGGGYLLTAARARRLSRQRSDLLQEVGLLQTALLPPVPESVGAVRTSVAYRPSDGPGAGGDFYDAMTLPGGRAAFILGDVSGHGRAALARTAFMRYTLRAYLEAGLDPRTTLKTAGRVIGEHLGSDFATVVVAVHDPRSGSLTYACAGHPAPIVVGPGRHEPVLAASSPPIGLGMPTGLRQTTLPLPAGSVACLYTDGLAEARTEGSILGRPRLGDIVEELGRDVTAQELLDSVAREARLVTDDMATVILTPNAGVTAGAFRSEQLEVDAAEADGDLPRRFFDECGLDEHEAASAHAETKRVARSHGGAVLQVEYGTRGPRADVLPRNVESLEAAAQRAARAVG